MSRVWLGVDPMTIHDVWGAGQRFYRCRHGGRTHMSFARGCSLHYRVWSSGSRVDGGGYIK
jgi:hypothetical protein